MLKLTDDEREQREKLQDAIDEARAKVQGINGAYYPMTAALQSLDALESIAIDDESMGRCEVCDRRVWHLADEDCRGDSDSGYFHAECFERLGTSLETMDLSEVTGEAP